MPLLDGSRRRPCGGRAQAGRFRTDPRRPQGDVRHESTDSSAGATIPSPSLLPRHRCPTGRQKGTEPERRQRSASHEAIIEEALAGVTAGGRRRRPWTSRSEIDGAGAAPIPREGTSAARKASQAGSDHSSTHARATKPPLVRDRPADERFYRGLPRQPHRPARRHPPQYVYVDRVSNAPVVAPAIKQALQRGSKHLGDLALGRCPGPDYQKSSAGGNDSR